jgi:predicted helicase
MSTYRFYRVTIDRDDWATKHRDSQYMRNIVKRVVQVSLETVRIVKALPALEERT